MAKENQYEFRELRKKLKEDLTKGRMEHTLGVEFISVALAMCYGEDVRKAQLAGLLHDCAKCIPDEEKVQLCRKYKLPINKAEEHSPYLLHAKLGAHLCHLKYGIDDEKVISAIYYHTTGRPAMTLLEKIVYVADYIEPRRDKAPNLAQIRKVAFSDIDEAVYLVARDTLKHIHDENDDEGIDALSEETYQFYKIIHEKKK